MPYTADGTYYPSGTDLHPSEDWWQEHALTGDATAKKYADDVNRNKGTVPDGSNLNDLDSTTESGTWALSGSYTYTNAPFTGAGVLLVEITSSGPGFQQAVKYASNETWQRYLSNPFVTPKVWGAWERVDSNPYKGVLPSGSLNDLDDFRENGFYALSALNTYTGAPFTGAGQVRVEVTGSGPGFQEAVKYATTETWRRALTNPFASPKVWGSWAQVGGASTATKRPAVDPGAPLEADLTNLTMWGDSLTAAGGIVAQLGALLPGVTVRNRGISGQSSDQIGARQGGVPATVTVAGDTIPASGSVAVTARSASLLFSTGNPAITLTGYLAGVHGTLSVPAGSTTYTFTRTTAGAAMPCPPESVFIADHGRDARRNAQIIWAGRNVPNRDNTLPNILDMVAHPSAARRRVVAMSITNAPDEGIGTEKYATIMFINGQLEAALADCFLDVRRWLIDEGLAAVGITPTTADTDAIAVDAVPPSLTSDGVHFTAAAQTAIGTWLHDQLVALGWYA